MAKKFKTDPYPWLPLPRLQMDTNNKADGTIIVDYSLYKEDMFGVTKLTLNKVTVTYNCDLRETYYYPFRAGSDMLHDMFTLKMRGFVTNGKESQERFLTKDEIPAGLHTKMYPKK